MNLRPDEPLKRRKLRLSSSLVAGGEEESWDCTVCTFKNSAEAFRCEVCQTRKGTSTRKPKLNQQIVEEQNLIARAIIKERQDEGATGISGTEFSTPHRRKYHRRLGPNSSSSPSTSVLKHGALLRHRSLRNVDQSSPQRFEVFANGFSVIITEYHPKEPLPALTPSGSKQTLLLSDSSALSTSALLVGHTSTLLENNVVDARYFDPAVTSCHQPAVVSKGINSAEHLTAIPLSAYKYEMDEEKKAKMYLNTKVPYPAKKDLSATNLTPSLVTPNIDANETPVEGSITATSVFARRKRRRHRLRSDISVNRPSRYLRSSTDSSAVTSRSRQASRIARASLYRLIGTLRPHKRRKMATPSTVAASSEAPLISEMTSRMGLESITAMADSCSAVVLEISAASAST